MRADDIDISPELRQKTTACKTPDELLELARQEGYELSDDELKSIAGGSVSWSLWCSDQTCPQACSADYN